MFDAALDQNIYGSKTLPHMLSNFAPCALFAKTLILLFDVASWLNRKGSCQKEASSFFSVPSKIRRPRVCWRPGNNTNEEFTEWKSATGVLTVSPVIGVGLSFNSTTAAANVRDIRVFRESLSLSLSLSLLSLPRSPFVDRACMPVPLFICVHTPTHTHTHTHTHTVVVTKLFLPSGDVGENNSQTEFSSSVSPWTFIQDIPPPLFFCALGIRNAFCRDVLFSGQCSLKLCYTKVLFLHAWYKDASFSSAHLFLFARGFVPFPISSLAFHWAVPYLLGTHAHTNTNTQARTQISSRKCGHRQR